MTTLTDDQKTILNDEIANDPEAKGYAALLPNEPGNVVDLLNAKTETKVGLVNTTDLTLWAVEAAMRSVIEDVAQDKTSPLRDSALAILDVLRGASSGIDFANPKNMQVLDAWQSLSKLSPANRDSLLLAATKPASRAEVVGLPYMTEELLRDR